MSVSYSSMAVMGVRVHEDDLCPVKKEKVRGCEHPIKSCDEKYCSECGAPAWKNISSEEDIEKRENILMDEMFEDLYAYHDSHDGYFYLGKVMSQADDYSARVLFSPLDNPKMLAAMESVKEVLEPMKLWNEDQFGLWHVFKCSC